MKEVEYKFVRRWPFGHFNPHHNILLTHKGETYELHSGAGNKDQIDVFVEGNRGKRKGGVAYVLNRNFGLNYIGLASFELPEKGTENIDLETDEEGEHILRPGDKTIFIQYEDEIEEIFPKGISISAKTAVKTLLSYIEE